MMNKCIKCGSYAFNLYKEDIDQGGLCDVHYWRGRAHRAEALEEQPAQQALDKMAKNARELGLDYEPAQQKPVAWRYLTKYKDQSVWTYCAFEPTSRETWEALYTSPPAQRPWVGLTDEEIERIFNNWPTYHLDHEEFAQAIESKLRSKNEDRS